MTVRRSVKQKNQIIICIAILSLLFPYENKFSYVNIASGTGRVSLEHTPEFTDRSDGYTRLARITEGYTTANGMPELPKLPLSISWTLLKHMIFCLRC